MDAVCAYRGSAVWLGGTRGTGAVAVAVSLRKTYKASLLWLVVSVLLKLRPTKNVLACWAAEL